MTPRFLTIGVAAMTAATISLTMAAPAAAQEPAPSNVAWFEDHWIDLSVSWEGATACDVAASGTVCFRTEAELDQYLAPSAAPVPRQSENEGAMSADAVVLAASACSSSLRLYDGTSYTGTVISISTRLLYVDLAPLGFDNRTSSYKVGACDSTFYSAAAGGGLVYPGDTSAFAQAATMVFGWDNAVSSVFIH